MKVQEQIKSGGLDMKTKQIKSPTKAMNFRTLMDKAQKDRSNI